MPIVPKTNFTDIYKLADIDKSTKVADIDKSTKVADIDKSTKVADVSTSTKVADIDKSTKVADVDKSTKVADVSTSTKVADMTEFTIIDNPMRTSQTLKTKPRGNCVRINFLNTNGNSFGKEPEPVDEIECFAEKPDEGKKDTIFYEVGGMSNYGFPCGPLYFKGTGKGVGFRLPQRYQMVRTEVANYKNYTDVNGVTVMGVRSTDFHLICTDQGDMFWLIVLHLAVGAIGNELKTIKRYRCMKSIMAQAHHLMKRYSYPVFVIGDFNCTRAELLQFKINEEGKPNARNNVLIPSSTGDATIGNFKTCFRFDGTDDIDLHTNVDLTTRKKWDIDHFFVPTTTNISKFEIDRSIINREGETAVYDHARLKIELVL